MIRTAHCDFCKAMRRLSSKGDCLGCGLNLVKYDCLAESEEEPVEVDRSKAPQRRGVVIDFFRRERVNPAEVPEEEGK